MENKELQYHIDQQEDLWVSIRRHIHENPELSFQEEQTAKFITEKLKSFGFKKVQTGIAGNGLYVDILSTDKKSDWILLRADMDALPIEEKNDVVYKSKNKGVMHACGHDVHSTVMLGVAKTAFEHKEQLKYNVRIIFQPGEELLPGGASLMIKEGILSDHDFKKAIALHVYPDLPAGELGFRPGMYMASCDEIYIQVNGKGGHGAMPHQLIDPVLLGSEIVTSLQQLVSRKCPPEIPSVLSFGRFIAEGATNVIPTTVKLAGTFRTYDEKWRKQAHQFIQSHVQLLCQAVGATADIEIRNGYPFLRNDETTTDELSQFAKSVLGESKVKELSLRPTGEDFAFFTQKIPSCFFRLGTADVTKKVNHGVHHPEFNIDEKALKVGIYFLSAYLLK